MNHPSTLGPAESGDCRTRTIAPEPAQPARALAWLARVLSQWQHRALARSELMRLNARQLRDIGLSKEQLSEEPAKPFWGA